jgi:phosphomannomutase/phosphoglucomutase
MQLPHAKKTRELTATPKQRAAPGLAVFWLAAFAATALILTVTAILLAHAWLSREKTLALSQLSACASATAETLVHRVAPIQESLRGLASDPSLQQIFRAQDEAAVGARERVLARQVPDASAIHLIAPNQIGEPDGKASKLSYAAINLLHQTTEGRKLSPIEIHRVAQPDAHLAIAAPVLDDQGARVLGLVHVALPLALLPVVSDAGGATGQILYQQAVGADFVTLAQKPGASVPATAPDRSFEIPGTSLRVAVWLKPTSLLDHDVLLWTALGLATILGFIALALWLTSRRLRQALLADQATLLGLVEDGVLRRALRQVDCHLAETDQFQERLMPLLDSVAAESASSGVPREVVPVQPESRPSFAPTDGQTDLATLSDQLMLDEEMSPAPKTTSAAHEAIDQTNPPSYKPLADLAADTAPLGKPFRGYDIRGIVGQDLDDATSRSIGQAVGSIADEQGYRVIYVARDTRESSESLTQALIAGLRGGGRDVIDLGVGPTPLLYFATRYEGAACGVMVTASHNPPEYNGYKIVIGGQSISGEQMKIIARRTQSPEPTGPIKGGYRELALADTYIDQVERDLTVARRMRLVVDCGNGAAAQIAPTLYRTLGCEVIEIHCNPHAGFPGGQAPDPSQGANLRELASAVTAQGADLGLGFDGDGDRLGVIDSAGRFIATDRVMMLFAADVLSRHPGSDIIFDVKSTHLLAAEVLRHGGHPVMSPSGHTHLKRRLSETGAPLAGELSGHIIFQERWFGFDDALYAGARLLELLALDPRPSAEVFALLPDALGTPELFLSLAEGEAQRIIAEILQLGVRLSSFNVNTIDGLRAEFDRGWGLVRASNTQPGLTFRFQGTDTEALKMMQTLFRRLMERVAPDLALPF